MASHERNEFVFTNADVSSTPFTTDMLRPATVKWTGDSTTVAGHQVVFVSAKSGIVLFSPVASGAYYDPIEQKFEKETTWEGLVIQTLDSGTVEFYHR